MPRATFCNNPPAIGGIVAVALGAFVLIESSDYARGTLLRMGPGYFPTILGAMLLILGALLVGTSMRRPAEPLRAPELRAPACIGLGVVLFALVLPRFGLAPAIALLVPAAACASGSSRLVPTIVLTLVLIVFAWIVFVELLALPFALITL
jgi:hypothetical protein